MSKDSKSFLSKVTISSIILYMRRHTYLTVAIVSWAVMIVLTLVFVIPQIQQISTQRSQIAVVEKKLADMVAKVQTLQALNPEELQAQRVLLQTVLPSQKPVTPLISSLEKLASDAGVSLKNFELSPGNVATDSSKPGLQVLAVKGLIQGVGALPLKLEVQGEFSQMNVFFQSLDTVVPLVNVKTIDFTQLTQNVSSLLANTQYKASVELESLYALPEAGTGKVDPNAVLPIVSAQERLLIASLSAQVAAQPPTSSVFVPVGSASGSLRRDTLFSF